jgi:hypothetical protein
VHARDNVGEHIIHMSQPAAHSGRCFILISRRTPFFVRATAMIILLAVRNCIIVCCATWQYAHAEPIGEFRVRKCPSRAERIILSLGVYHYVRVRLCPILLLQKSHFCYYSEQRRLLFARRRRQPSSGGFNE